jgi:hypothetical protein
MKGHHLLALRMPGQIELSGTNAQRRGSKPPLPLPFVSFALTGCDNRG